MTHLQETDFVDLIDGTLPAARASHLETCERCRSTADEIRASMAMAGTDDVPEPSPLFWQQFAGRVHERVETAPERTRWIGIPRFVFVPLGALAVLAISFTLLRPARVVDPQMNAPVAAATGTTASPTLDDLELDEDWAIVRAAADGLDIEDAQAAGLMAAPGTAERIAMDLTEAERAELLRLLQSEIKTGA